MKQKTRKKNKVSLTTAPQGGLWLCPWLCSVPVLVTIRASNPVISPETERIERVESRRLFLLKGHCTMSSPQFLQAIKHQRRTEKRNPEPNNQWFWSVPVFFWSVCSVSKIPKSHRLISIGKVLQPRWLKNTGTSRRYVGTKIIACEVIMTVLLPYTCQQRVELNLSEPHSRSRL